MQVLELTLPDPAANLALDEALLEEAEAGGQGPEVLRLWQPAAPMVVVGRSSRLADEVREEACQQLSVPVMRRCSGGSAIVTGPGCLMYAVVLDLDRRPELRAVDRAHRFVLGTIANGLDPLAPGVRCRGISDLVLGERKVSGNSLRLRRRHLLYHGTLLYDFPLELIGRCLKMPPRQPDYREGRDHGQFVTNLPVALPALREAMIAAWGAAEPLTVWPQQRTAELCAVRYGQPAWHRQR